MYKYLELHAKFGSGFLLFCGTATKVCHLGEVITSQLWNGKRQQCFSHYS